MKITKSQIMQIIKEELVAVKGGLGSLRLDQIQTDLRRKLEDLLARADAGKYYTIGKNELDVLANMWLTVSETMPREQNEAWGGAKGPFPDRYGQPRRGAPATGRLRPPAEEPEIYAADDELRELGDKISEMVVLSRQVEELMLDMGMRYGEMAALGTNARTIKKLIKELEDTFDQKLDDIERFSK